MSCSFCCLRIIVMVTVQEIASTKLPDLNTTSVDAAMNIVAGTARNMGITITE